MQNKEKKYSPETSTRHKPLVSIVTPAYNAEKFIEDTLKSVMNQEYPNIEHIVLDDGSTDNTVNILKKYENKYNLRWCSKPNEGQAVTVNKGIDIARGEIVVWLNADDVLFDTKVVSSVVEYFKRKPKIGVVYGHMAIMDEKNRLLKVQCAIPWLNYKRLLRAHFAACIFYRKKLLPRYKLDPTLNFVMDYEQCLRMVKDGVKFGYLNKILISYRRHKATKSISRRKDLKAETEEIRKRFGQKFGFYYLSMKLIDDLLLFLFKIYGVKTVVKVYSSPEKFHIAFPIKFDMLLKLAIRQIIPYM